MYVRRGIVVVAVFAIALVAGLQSRALAAGEIAEITEAPALTWGFKSSWRNYAPLPQTEGGATAAGAGIYQIAWPFLSGSFDSETGTTHLSYGGSVHWQKYRASELDFPEPPGYEGEPDPYLLDVTLSEPQITIGRDASAITAVATSRSKVTWELIEYGRVPIVDLDVLGVTPATVGGTTQWSGISASLAATGAPVFDDIYLAGKVVDEVGFSYTGPGGAPDLTEHWDEPGAPALKLLRNELFIQSEAAVNLEMPSWIDEGSKLVHSSIPTKVGNVNTRRFQAFDLEQMAPVGEPWTAPAQADFPQAARIVAHDTTRQRLLYRATGQTGITRWIEFDGDEYKTGVFADPQLSQASFIGGNSFSGLVWDPTRDRGYRVQRVVPEGVDPEAYDAHQWQLITYREGGDGTWIKQSYPLPGFGPGQNQTGYAEQSTYQSPTYAIASDGSLIVLATARETSTDPSNPPPATIPAAYRLLIDEEAGSVTVEPLPVEIENTQPTFEYVRASPNGQLLLGNLGGKVVRCQIHPAGEVECGEPLLMEGFEANAYRWWRFATDPASGTTWVGGVATQRLGAIRDSGFVAGQFFKELNPRGGLVVAGEGGIVYAQTNDGSPDEAGGSKTWGFGRFEHLGFVPEVVAQPQPESAALAVGEASEQVTFSSQAEGEPAPSRRWQVKAPGSQKFTDLAGEIGPTLSVAATAADGGSEFRAVYENAAGRVATDAATLAVDYAPRLLADLGSVSVPEGGDAEFSVLPDGQPAPSLAWQRRVDGFWEPIAADDDNFVIGGSSLTVVNTNTDQSGARFRARLTNALGTVYSKEARLTVSPKASIPEEGVDVERASLDWTGNPEMQKAPPFGGSNYFSAGISGGDEATYGAATGNVRVFQVSAGGGEALASYATRAAHVAGDGDQLVRLYGGRGRIEADGSASVEWAGSFSVNFYGGLVPFSLTDPELSVDADGNGTLSADLGGCESSQANPDECAPMAPAADVTVATFSGVEIDPSGEIEIAPDYAGVEVEVPDTPQDRSVAGWGAWPQPFVDFHLKTGLSSYWYTSGSTFDPEKPPHPFSVDFDDPSAPPAEPPRPGPGAPQAPAQPVAETGPPSIAVAGAARSVNRRGLATVATVSCPSAIPCEVSTPRRVAVRIAGVRYRARVIAPRQVEAGGSAAVRAKLPRRAVAALAGARATLKVRIAVRVGEWVTSRLARVAIRGPLRTLAIGDGGLAALGEVRCEAAAPCSVRTRKRVTARAGGRVVTAKVIAPRRLGGGRAAGVGLKLDRGALRRLAGHDAVFRVRVALRSRGARSVQVLEARLKRRAAGGDSGAPTAGPLSAEPPLLARPASAVDVSAVKVTWYPRDSWVRYASSGVAPGDGIAIADGAAGVPSTASACPDQPSTSDAELPYAIEFAPRASWHDPVSGMAGIYGQGSASFRWKAHKINLTAADPEIEINGAASRAIFRFSGAEGTPYPNQRAALVSLDLSGQPAVADGGKTLTYSLMRGTLTPDGVNVFAGFYTPPDNDEFGCVSVSFTTP